MADITTLLINTLEDLEEEELKKFRLYLSQEKGPGGVTLIPNRKLKKKSRTEIVEKMLKAYEHQEAPKITIQILKKMNRNDLAQELGGTFKEGSEACSTRDTAMKNAQEALKSSLIQRFKVMSEGIAKYKKKTLLNDVYTDIYMTEGECEATNNEHEVTFVENQSKKQKARELDVLSTDIFKPLPGQSKQSIRTVLTKGIAGIGKTVFMQKFILDWAEGKDNQDVNLIFILPFRELNLLQDEKYSLMDLVNYFHPELKVYGSAFWTSKRVLFIFDGLDESRIELNFQVKKWSDTKHPTSLNVLLTNLIKGDLLPSALLWITTRPAAASQIPPKYIDRMTDVQGFKDPQKEEFFIKRFSNDEALAKRIITSIKSTRTLYIMCYMPVFCWISATVFEEMDSKTEGKPCEPKTLTELYTRFLLILTNIKKEKYGRDSTEPTNESEKEIIQKLSELALKNLINNKVQFSEVDLNTCQIKIDELFVYSGLCTEIFKNSEIKQCRMFSFVHLTIQEYLAALFVFLSYRKDKVDRLQKSDSCFKYPKLFRKSTLFDLHKNAVDKALDQNGKLDLFLRFLLGISRNSEDVQELLKGLMSTDGPPQDLKKTAKYIETKIKSKNLPPERCINLFHCLIELGDSSLVQQVQAYLGPGDKEGNKKALSPAQCSALAYLLMMSEETADEFDLKKYTRSNEGLLRLLPVIKNYRGALLDDCNLTKVCCASLAHALHSDLRQLTLSDNDLQDSGVELLFEELVGDCKLEKLRLDGCKLTAKICLKLSKCPHLKELDLSNNNLKELGTEKPFVERDWLFGSVETLRLKCCKLTESGCKVLKQIISSHPSNLKVLDLSENDLEDSGVKWLSEGLKSKDCKLETLSIDRCKLAAEGCKELALAFSSMSTQLRVLDLSDNDLEDSGVKFLSEGLGKSQCKLEILRLVGCKVTERGCASLASAIRSNPLLLRELDLSYNHLGDKGLKLLSALLQDREIPLEKLRVDHGGECRIKPGLLKYTCQLSLDPNTVHKNLCLSEADRKVILEDNQAYPDSPERFDRLEQVLCREGLSEGRFYWEAEWRGCWTSVGVAYKGIRRKGKGEECQLGHNEVSWSLFCSNAGCSGQHNKKFNDIHIPSSSTLQRIGVYLDWPAGVLSFYSVCPGEVTLLHRFYTTFTEPLYPGFGVGFELMAGQKHRLDCWEEPSYLSLC